jgi:hypothetical protein
MPLSQRDQYSNRKGMGLVRLGGVLCLAAFLFGSVCFTIVAMMGDGEDPPKIFEQLGGASCGLFALGLILGLVGWLISLNQPEPPKPTAASAGVVIDDDEDEELESAKADDRGDQQNKPDPYASKHRRKGI